MVHIIWMITWSFAPLTSPMIKSAIAKFMMYKLFIVRRRGFDKNDRKMIIFPKTVKKLNFIIILLDTINQNPAYHMLHMVKLFVWKKVMSGIYDCPNFGIRSNLHLCWPTSLMDFEAPRSCHRPNFISCRSYMKKIR